MENKPNEERKLNDFEGKDINIERSKEIEKNEYVNPLVFKTDFPQTKIDGENYEIPNELDKVNNYDIPNYLYEDLDRSEYSATIEEMFADSMIEEPEKTIIPEKETIENENISEEGLEEEIIEEEDE